MRFSVGVLYVEKFKVNRFAKNQKRYVLKQEKRPLTHDGVNSRRHIGDIFKALKPLNQLNVRI